MNPLFEYLWPGIALAIVLGASAATIGFRRRFEGGARLGWLGGFAVAGLVGMALWSGPLGAADRFAGRVEGVARTTLDYYEMNQVKAGLQRGPLSRRIELSGSADSFQAGELVRLMGEVPGAHDARWSKARYLPLLAEGALGVVAGFLLGMLLAYLFELHRRYNAQWKW